MILTKAGRALRKRPLLALTTSTVSSTLSYAYYIEQRTNLETKQHINNTTTGRLELQNEEETWKKYTLPQDYDRDALCTYWNHRPISVLQRLATISSELIPFAFLYLKDSYVQHYSPSSFTKSKEEIQTYHAQKLRHILTKLGPAFVKLGQQLSIRPDLLPAHVLFELQRLCDDVEPISDEVARKVLLSELGNSIRIVGDDDNNNDDDDNGNRTDCQNVIWIKDLKKVASASLGQVYKAKRVLYKRRSTKMSEKQEVKEEEDIAIKIQRPEMKHKVSLDLYLLNNYGSFLDYIFDILTNQIPFHESFINCFAHGSYNELDYIKEASNQNYLKKELSKRGIDENVVYIPDVFADMTSEKVLTMKWVDGIKLANANVDDVQKLIPVGVELFLTQLLDIGFFHSDPHPGKKKNSYFTYIVSLRF